MDTYREVPVLIVGAGPAGLAVATTLARHGVPSLLVERRSHVSHVPRATAVSTRSMELLRTWGLDDDVLAGAADVEWLLWQSETLASAADGVVLPSGFPTRAQAAVVSPAAPACVPQDHLEPVMRAALERDEHAAIEIGTELMGLEPLDSGGVVARLRDSSGRERNLVARYLVGADGVRSTVRQRLGVRAPGTGSLSERLTALFRAPLWDVVGDRRFGLYVVTRPGAEAVILPAGPDDRWIWAKEWDPSTERQEDYTPQRIAASIRASAGVDGLDPRIERIGAFSFSARLADRFRAGDVFLAGDAAHQVTPRGGTGLNTALQDGHALGWRIAWVLMGWAPPTVLDGYETERRPVAAHNMARSIDPDPALHGVEQAFQTDLGGRIPHVWLDAGRTSTVDVLGLGFTLFTGPEAAPWEAAVRRLDLGPPVAVKRLDVLAARAMGVRGDGALLARPDGLPAGAWADAPASPTSALRAAVGAVSGRAGDERWGAMAAAV